MSENAQAQQQKRPQIMDFERFSLFTPTPGAPEGRRARLAFGIRDGNPRISVFTNDPNHSGGKGVLSAPMDPTTFYVFLDSLENVIKSSGETKHKIDCLVGIRDAETKRVTDKKLGSTLWYGKDDKGTVWISVLSEGAPKIRFDFGIYEYHFYYKADGTKVTAAEGSCVHAMAMVRLMRQVYGNLIAKASEEQAIAKMAFRANGGGNAGGYRKDSGAMSNTASDLFEDIPQ